MKQYLVDELRPEDHAKIKTYLEDRFGETAFEGLYWIPLDQALLSDKQQNHVDCQPFYFAIELSAHQVSCELLLRTQQKVRCDCIQYATKDQRNWLIDMVDAVLEQLEIIS